MYESEASRPFHASPTPFSADPAAATSPALTGAELVVRELERQGITWVVGIPGGAILPLYDALATSTIQHVLARHEQGAGFIAQGAARVTGKAAVCLATSGPGATNLLTALADAKADSIPLVAITAQVPRPLIGTDAFQEVDTCALAKPITKACFQATSADELLHLLPKVFAIATDGRPGPVLLDIPKDVLNERHTSPEPVPVALTPGLVSSASAKPTQSLESGLPRLVEMLRASERPLLYVGGGIHMACAGAALRALVAHSDLPVVSTLQGLGALPADDPRWLGMLGMHGAAYTNLATDEADLVIAVGARFDDRATGNPALFCRNARLVHIDIDPREIGKIKAVELGIVADARVALTALRALLPEEVRPAWRRRLKALRREAPLRHSGEAMDVLARVADHLPANAIVTTDVGQHQMWVAQVLPFCQHRTLVTSGGLGTMGFGLPAAIGAALACPERPVLCVSGDGSFLMNIQELALLPELCPNLTVLILNNRQLGMVRQQQDLFYGARHSASRFQRDPDFAAIAQGFGVAARNLTAREFCSAPATHLAFAGPLLLNVLVADTENVLPMVPPGRSNLDMILE
jgi:acetolactate synthase I/II/III large subunit